MWIFWKILSDIFYYWNKTHIMTFLHLLDLLKTIPYELWFLAESLSSVVRTSLRIQNVTSDLYNQLFAVLQMCNFSFTISSSVIVEENVAINNCNLEELVEQLPPQLPSLFQAFACEA